MTWSEFKAELDEFLSGLEWQDNASYEMKIDDSDGEGSERWRAELKTDGSFHPERILDIVENPEPGEHGTKLAISSGDDSYLDLTPEWFFGWMWITAEIALRGATEQLEKARACLEKMTSRWKCRECGALFDHVKGDEDVKRCSSCVRAEAAESDLLRLTNEISCRIDHGASSGGHLEGLQAIIRQRKANRS